MEYDTPTIENCRELYAVVDTNTGRLYFGTNGKAYKNLKTVTNKLNNLKSTGGDHFEIVTYYLSGSVNVSKEELLDFLEG